MMRFFTLIVTACLASSAFAAETPTITEAYSCTLNPGQTMADFDKAAAAWQADMDEIPGGDQYFAAVLTPLRANVPFDLLWLGSSANLNNWAKNTAVYNESAEGRAAQRRFDKVAMCGSGLWYAETLHEGLAPAEVGSTSVVEAYQCSLREGKTLANVSAANASWLGVIKAESVASPAVAKFDGYMFTPFLANVDYDVAYLVVHEDLAGFGAMNTSLVTSAGNAGVAAGFDDTFRCTGGLWNGKLLRQPAMQE